MKIKQQNDKVTKTTTIITTTDDEVNNNNNKKKVVITEIKINNKIMLTLTKITAKTKRVKKTIITTTRSN